MPVMVISKFDKNLIKNEFAINQTTYSQLQVHEKKFRYSGEHDSKMNILTWHKVKLIQDLMPVLVSCSFNACHAE